MKREGSRYFDQKNEGEYNIEGFFVHWDFSMTWSLS